MSTSGKRRNYQIRKAYIPMGPPEPPMGRHPNEPPQEPATLIVSSRATTLGLPSKEDIGRAVEITQSFDPASDSVEFTLTMPDGDQLHYKFTQTLMAERMKTDPVMFALIHTMTMRATAAIHHINPLLDPKAIPPSNMTATSAMLLNQNLVPVSQMVELKEKVRELEHQLEMERDKNRKIEDQNTELYRELQKLNAAAEAGFGLRLEGKKFIETTKEIKDFLVEYFVCERRNAS